jgi:lipopolysaccharide transport system ATP-binding protein
MSDVVIEATALGKQYRLNAPAVRYQTLRDTLAAIGKRPLDLVGVRPNSRSRSHPRKQTIWALRGVSFEVQRGEVVGVIGRNGAGKSTLLKILSRITEPTEGHAAIHGRVGSLLEVGTGFHNELTGRENIYLNGAILGMKKREIDRNFDEIVSFAEVEKFIDTPVKHYSSGMHVRLAFAVAAHLQSDILLVDEVLAVGDAAFQRKCLGKIGEVAHAGRTVLFVSHNMGAVRSLCNRGIVLDGGSITEAGSLGACMESYYRLTGAFAGDGGQNGGPPGPHRSGFGLIELAGTSGNTVTQGAEFEVRTWLRIDQNISGLSLHCVLDDMHGRKICHLREESPQLGLGAVDPGVYAISVRFPPLWLNPGLYSLYFKATIWGASGSARQVSETFPLDLAGVSSPVTASVLHPKAVWAVSAARSRV